MVQNSLSKEEVFKAVVFRNKREYPVMTVTEIAEQFEHSRHTVWRRVEELAADGWLQEKTVGKGSYYWPHLEADSGSCPTCGGRLQRSHEQPTEIGCKNCKSIYFQVAKEDSITTDAGRVMEQAMNLYEWWTGLSERTRGVIVSVAAWAFNRPRPELEYPDHDDRTSFDEAYQDPEPDLSGPAPADRSDNTDTADTTA